MSSTKLVVQGAAGALGVESLNVEDVFSTYLYDGTGANQTITNGIDLDGEGGLVWIKVRDWASGYHSIHDTERGATKRLTTNTTDAETTRSGAVTAFNSNGFSVGNFSYENYDGGAIASWTFRKAPKFFDVVTYTGNATAGRTISHNLGCEVGMIIVKATSTTGNWWVYHRSAGGTVYGTTKAGEIFFQLEGTNAANDNIGWWNNTDATDTEFTLGSGSTNTSGVTYVAYLFAHNDGDGEFGPDGDADIIKCGSFTTNANGDASIELGFEPQWVLLKRTDSAQSWWLADTMRGMTVGTTGTPYLVPDQSYAEDSTYTNYINPTATGFGVDAFSGSADYIYIAIRRGPMAVPDDADDVFAVTTQSGSTAPAHDTGFVTDFSLRRENALSSTSIIHAVDRLRGKYYLNTTGTNTETGLSNNTWDFMDGWFGATSDDSNKYAWSWKRAPNYFDVVAYTGNGTAGRTVSHNLGVAPEMMWVKRRNSVSNWSVYHSDVGNTKYLVLNTSNAAATFNYWNNTDPTATTFGVSSSGAVNASGDTYIAYLFASVDGVSKVGSFTHTSGAATDVDCGFSSGARFILVKRSSAGGDWMVWDTERGIVAGDDPYLELNNTNAEITGDDLVDPLSSGFSFASGNSDGTYIFYAIA